MSKPPKSRPTWVDVKGKLAGFDRDGLLHLMKDLYEADKNNQTFLHTRLGLGDDLLKPYKQVIERWISPDVYRDQRTSVSKANQAVSSYKKAVGEPAGLAELMTYYCELAADFCASYGEDDPSYLQTLMRMFEQAVVILDTLPEDSRQALLTRLERVCSVSQKIGYGVGDGMSDILAEWT